MSAFKVMPRLGRHDRALEINGITTQESSALTTALATYNRGDSGQSAPRRAIASPRHGTAPKGWLWRGRSCSHES